MSTKVLTGRQAIDAEASFRKILSGDVPLLKARYGLGRAFDKLEVPLKPFFKERESLIKEYKEVDPNTGFATGFKEDKDPEEFQTKWEELLDLEIDVEVYDLKLSWFEDAHLFLVGSKNEKIPVPAQDLHNIRFWIKDDLEEVEKAKPKKVKIKEKYEEEEDD